MSRTLMALSAVIALSFGALHLFMTYRGPKLRPRDPALQELGCPKSPRSSAPDHDVARVDRLQCQP